MLVGDILPLNFQLSDYNPGVFVHAILRDDTNTLIGSPVVLTAVGTLGYYGNAEVEYPSGGTKWVTAQYICYDDSGYTSVSTTEGGGLDTFFLTSASSSSTPVGSYITGFLDGGPCQPCEQNATEDTIVEGSDRTLNIRLVSNPQLLPLDLTGASLVRCQFVNGDGSYLTLNSTDAGNPVVITQAPAGQLYCILTKVQTALLGVASPAPMTVTVVLPQGTIVVNFPYQLSIEAPLV